MFCHLIHIQPKACEAPKLYRGFLNASSWLVMKETFFRLGGSPLCTVLKITLQPEISLTTRLNGMINIIVVPAGRVKGDPYKTFYQSIVDNA